MVTKLEAASLLFQSAGQSDAYIERFMKGLQPEVVGAGNASSSDGQRATVRHVQGVEYLGCVAF